MELTTKEYWQKYYAESGEDRELIRLICGKYDRFWDLMMDSVDHKPATVLEIGAFPGRYLAYVASRFGLKPTGIDFNPDVEKFARNMRAMGVNEFDYLCKDFLVHRSSMEYDMVFSNGFVEHFENYDKVLDLHVSYLKPGGSLLLMVPNKRYLRALYGNLLDRRNQLAHNLACMRLSVFEHFGKRNNLRLQFLSYYGGFPYKVHTTLSFWQKLIYYPVRFLSLKLTHVLSKYPHRFWSGTIIAVYHKPK